MSRLPEAQVLCVLVQKEFSERQNSRQAVNQLIQDACEGGKWAGEGAVSQGLSRLHFYICPHSLCRCQAYVTNSFFESGRRVFEPMRSNLDCNSTYSNQQKAGNTC